jgi:hypothetical protein
MRWTLAGEELLALAEGSGGGGVGCVGCGGGGVGCVGCGGVLPTAVKKVLPLAHVVSVVQEMNAFPIRSL